VVAGGGDTASNKPAFIVGGVTYYPAPLSSYEAVVFVQTDGTNRIPITNATVTINGVALALSQNNTIYTSSSVVPDGSGNFTLSVTANGTTYTTTQSAFTTPPVVTVPAFSASIPNTITWTAPAGAPSNPGNGMYYELLIQLQGTNASVYSSAALIDALTANIPAHTTQANTSYIATVIGIRFGPQIPNAVAGSNLNSSTMSLPVPFTTLP
jgi:hypothetical protein